MSISVAILGSGIFAREEHKPAVEAAGNLTLKAVYSRSLKSAKILELDEKEVDLYSDDSGPGRGVDDLLSRVDIHAVIIALPVLKQPEFIKRALQAGKHVLSEKPIAADIKTATDLLHWYRSEIDVKSVFWSVAENFRFYKTFNIACLEREKQGRALTFRLKMQAFVQPGTKYFETEWRKTPGYQGGFILDGGVHFAAGIRKLLGKEDPIVSVSAFTVQLQPHLPPVDTVEAIAKTKSGAVGTISISFGTTAKGREYTVASEGGVVSVGFDEITINGVKQEVSGDRWAVAAEVKTWADSIVAGQPIAALAPEEALGDLSIVEAILTSGDANGALVTVQNQQW